MIWLWRNPKTLPQKRMGEYIPETGTDRFEFLKGVTLDSKDIISPRINFECDEKYLTDVLPSSGNLIIVSEKVLKILNGICPNDIQAFKANVFLKEKPVDDYYLLNITNTLEVFDNGKCVFTKYMGAITSINKIVYKTDNLSKHDIVRNADFTPHVLVSERLKEAFKKAKIKGVEFRQEP